MRLGRYDNPYKCVSYAAIDPAVQREPVALVAADGGLTSGILHTESATQKENTLGQFFTEWNVALTPSCVATYCSPATPVAVYVRGRRFTGDPRTIALSDQEEIAIVIGTPPAQIPASFTPTTY